VTAIDETHDPALTSWVESANDPLTDFPIQNLPFGRFRLPGQRDWRVGVAIGDDVLDLRGAQLIDSDVVERLLQMPPDQRHRLRHAISRALRRASIDEPRLRECLLPRSQVELGLPCRIGDYTDFYVGIHHATAVGRLFRPDNPLLPNYRWVPIGYHGRASTIIASGRDFARPLGQIKPADTDTPRLAATARLDYELEMGIVIGTPNTLGAPIGMESAEAHVFGLTLLNDWTARDLQAWEYQPLGPFLSKNFATTLSPWVVTLEALAPYRTPFRRPAGEPGPLPHLDSSANRQAGAFDVGLEAWLQTGRMRAAGQDGDRIATSNFAEAAYWTVSQLVAHHTTNGCALSTGDLLGTGTLSGPRRDEAGSLLELTEGGARALTLSNGERRTFLEDGDTVILRGRCERRGFRRIGFGECRATVLPAIAPSNRC
jgi:fumarylacetoacetase